MKVKVLIFCVCLKCEIFFLHEMAGKVFHCLRWKEREKSFTSYYSSTNSSFLLRLRVFLGRGLPIGLLKRIKSSQILWMALVNSNHHVMASFLFQSYTTIDNWQQSYSLKLEKITQYEQDQLELKSPRYEWFFWFIFCIWISILYLPYDWFDSFLLPQLHCCYSIPICILYGMNTICMLIYCSIQKYISGSESNAQCAV